jgi:hypothetical protein
VFSKINYKLYVTINDSKFIDYNQISSQKANINILFFILKKTEYLPEFETKF